MNGCMMEQMLMELLSLELTAQCVHLEKKELGV
jgi:hypothetical protein